jgi:outer membrane protein assembly factor BamB
VNKILGIFLILFLVNHCSLDKKSGIWTKPQKIKEVKKIEVENLIKKDEILKKEFNQNLKIKISAKLINNSFVNNFDNNNGRVNYNGNLKNISKFKFSKIDNFGYYEPEIVFDNDNVIFFDNKGSILKFNNSSKLIWKKNYYSKNEKKLKPILFFAKKKNTLIVTDNITRYYALDTNSGNLLWSKNNIAPFNSQVKIYKDRFFVVDFENILRCYSIKDGKEIWKLNTEKSFLKSQKKLSLIIVNKIVYFNNSLGDISAVDAESGNLLWQTPTQSTAIYENAFLLKTSDLVADEKSILLSNNKNEFFSLDLKTGNLNWKQKVNSNLRSTIIDNMIFSITIEGFLTIMEKNSGNILRNTDLFKEFNNKKRKNIKPIGFIVGTDKIYLTTNNGRLIIVDIMSGRKVSTLKIDNENISRPFILNQNLFIIKENSIIKLN